MEKIDRRLNQRGCSSNKSSNKLPDKYDADEVELGAEADCGKNSSQQNMPAAKSDITAIWVQLEELRTRQLELMHAVQDIHHLVAESAQIRAPTE